MQFQDKIRVLELLTGWAQKEAELMWHRHQSMLIVNTGLIAILSFSLEKKLEWGIYISCFVGLLLSYAWRKIIILSQYYYQRWQLDADELIKSENDLSSWIKGRNEPRLEPPSKLAASDFAKRIPSFFLAGWLLVCFANMAGCLKI